MPGQIRDGLRHSGCFSGGTERRWKSQGVGTQRTNGARHCGHEELWGSVGKERAELEPGHYIQLLQQGRRGASMAQGSAGRETCAMHTTAHRSRCRAWGSGAASKSQPTGCNSPHQQTTDASPALVPHQPAHPQAPPAMARPQAARTSTRWRVGGGGQQHEVKQWHVVQGCTKRRRAAAPDCLAPVHPAQAAPLRCEANASAGGPWRGACNSTQLPLAHPPQAAQPRCL